MKSSPRSSDGGKSLIGLFTHENAQVRFNAATGMSGTFPSQAQEVLEKITGSNDALAFDAKMYLHTLEEWTQRQKSR